MRLFIYSGVCRRKGVVNISEKEGYTTLKFPDCSEGNQRIVEIAIQNLKKKELKKSTWVNNIEIAEMSKEKIVFANGYVPSTGEIYALFRTSEIVPDDVYIPKDKKDNVTVIRRIRFWDKETDLGFFKSNVYLFKIRLRRKEKLPIYLTYEGSKWVQKSIEFYRNMEDNWGYHIRKTKISNENGDFISLSELI